MHDPKLDSKATLAKSGEQQLTTRGSTLKHS